MLLCPARSNGIPDSDAAIRQFLALSSGSRAGEADRAGPSSIDIRDMRSLSLSFSFPSFSLMGPPIGVSLPDSDLSALKRFLRGSVGGAAPDGTPAKVLPALPCPELRRCPLLTGCAAIVLLLEWHNLLCTGGTAAAGFAALIWGGVLSLCTSSRGEGCVVLQASRLGPQPATKSGFGQVLAASEAKKGEQEKASGMQVDNRPGAPANDVATLQRVRAHVLPRLVSAMSVLT